MSSEGEKSLQLVELLPWVKANLSAGKPSALWSLEALEECSICVLDPTGLHEVDGCGGGLVFVSIRTRFNRHCAFLFNMLYPKGFIEIQYLVCSEWTVPSAGFLSLSPPTSFEIALDHVDVLTCLAWCALKTPKRANIGVSSSTVLFASFPFHSVPSDLKHSITSHMPSGQTSNDGLCQRLKEKKLWAIPWYPPPKAPKMKDKMDIVVKLTSSEPL